MAIRKTTSASVATETKQDDAPFETEQEAVSQETHEEAQEVRESALKKAQQESAPELPKTKAVSAPANAAMTTFEGGEDEDDDLDSEIGFGSFDIIKLDKDKFICKDKEFDEFECVIFSHRFRHLYKGGDPNDSDAPIFFTYDKKTTTSGDRVEDVVAEWQAAGLSVTTRKYFEGQAMVVSDTEGLKGELVLLSVPPASIRRIAGYKKTQELMHGHKSLKEYVTRIEKGSRVKVGSNSFYPWEFKYGGPVTEELIADAQSAAQ